MIKNREEKERENSPWNDKKINIRTFQNDSNSL